MTSQERQAILREYSAGQLGTRTTIERLGLDDFADLIIALASENLHLPRPVETPTLAAHSARAAELLMPRLRRGR